MRLDVPVDPDDEQARDWLEQELGRGDDYVPAEEPGWWQDFLDWLNSLFGGGQPQAPGAPVEGGATVGVIVAIVLVVAVLLVAFRIFGLPRLRRRTKVTGDLFGDDEQRSAAELRSAAQQAADAGDYTTAIVDSFRSLARDLAERGLVLTFPGTTARDFARRAGAMLPDTGPRLTEAAVVFDDLRYLGGVGTLAQWTSMSALESEVRAIRRPRTARAVDAFGRAPADDDETVAGAPR